MAFGFGRQVAELARLLKPGGVLSYSSWVRAEPNPIYDPVAAVFGAPATGFAPDQWGDPPVVQARLSDAFGQIEIENHRCRRRGELRVPLMSWSAPSPGVSAAAQMA